MCTTIYRSEDPILRTVDEEETGTDAYALLYRFVWPD